MNPPVNGKTQGLFKDFECFSSTFHGKFIFKDFSRQSCIFKFFFSLNEPCSSKPWQLAVVIRTIILCGRTDFLKKKSEPYLGIIKQNNAANGSFRLPFPSISSFQITIYISQNKTYAVVQFGSLTLRPVK